MSNLDFFFFDAGGGHRSAALALKAVIAEQYPSWNVRLVNLQEILDSLDIFRKFTGIRLQDVYNLMLKKGMTLGSKPLLGLMHGLIRLYHSDQVKLLEAFWQKGKPDLVVSLIPNFNRAIFQSLRSDDRLAGTPPTPMVTILTDLADYPPHFWMERQEQFFICGTEKAAGQAHSMGHPGSRVFLASGMIVRPPFYETVEADKCQERRQLGLDPELPAGLVLFGGQGSNRMVSIARRVNESKLKVQLIFICGKNPKLRERLRALDLQFPHYIEGFTSEIPYYMRLSDFFIGKPGPGSISEALVMKLPIIVERNAWTLPQEIYNADWVEEKKAGIVLSSFREIGAGLERLLAPEEFAKLRANAEAVKIRAVFEIPALLDRLLSGRADSAQVAQSM